MGREGRGGRGGRMEVSYKGVNTYIFYISFSDYKDPKNRISFFKEYAVARGFDPLVPDNWYTIKHREILLANVCPLLLSSPSAHLLLPLSAPLTSLLLIDLIYFREAKQYFRIMEEITNLL